jgi:hypothetical protein
MRCPDCLSYDLVLAAWDAGRCSQTGYHDAGEEFHCRTCGATGEAGELVELPAKREPRSETAAPMTMPASA